MSTSTPTLLGIPPELRQHIYSHLIPESPTSHPLPGIGLTAVSHHPPAAALLDITPQISDEILEYYYSIATWRLILSPNIDFFRVDQDLKGLERSVVLTQLRKLEITFLCDAALLSEYPSNPSRTRNAMEQRNAELKRRTTRMCQVFLKAEKLRAVTISWVDSRGDSPRALPWLREYAMLEPFAELLTARHPITFTVGRVEGPPRDGFVEAMQHIFDPNGLRPRSESTEAESKGCGSVLRPMTKLWTPPHPSVMSAQQGQAVPKA